MTEGPLLPKILAFSGPLILTGILQLLYNAADVIVVGNYAGHEALAAVSSTGSLINLLVNVFMGLSVGASVAVARNYGARDVRAMRKAEHTAMTLALFMGVGVGIMGFVLARPLLQLMDSPPDVIDGAALYVRIYFLGMPANMLYNFGAAIMRAVGDTKRPMVYLMISGLVNVLLNLLLVIVFHMDVAGVAIATVASQVVSMVLVLLCLLRTRGEIQLNPGMPDRLEEPEGDHPHRPARRAAGQPVLHFQRADPVLGQLLRIPGGGRKRRGQQYGGLCLYGHERPASGGHDLCQPELRRREGGPGAEDALVLPGRGDGDRAEPGPGDPAFRRAADEPVQLGAPGDRLRHGPDGDHHAHLFPLRADGRHGRPAAGRRLFDHADDRFPDRRLPAADRLDYDGFRAEPYPDGPVYVLSGVVVCDFRDPLPLLYACGPETS